MAAALLDGALPAQLRHDVGYVQRLAARAGGCSLKVLPLVHPGQRKTKWTEAHELWMGSLV